jgi:DNA-binding SARP family transcriptional activator
MPVVLNGDMVVFRSRRERAPLAFLVVEDEQYHKRSVLTNLLYPDMPEVNALRNVHQALARMRHVIRERDNQTPMVLMSRDGLQ